VQIVVMLIFAIWLSLWFGQLCSRGYGTGCQGVQFNAKWTKIPMLSKQLHIILLTWIWGPCPLYLWKLARNWCELGKDGTSNTFIRLYVQLQRLWYRMPGCSVQCKMNKNTHGYMTMWYTKGIYASFVNCFVVCINNVQTLGLRV
jgi:hypothetical protein